MSELITNGVTPGKEDNSSQERAFVSEDNGQLFEEDYSVYADRGPNCIDWSNIDS